MIPAFAGRLRRYAQDQARLDPGAQPVRRRPLLRGGRAATAPEYRFLGSFEYTNAPGGIVNGITAGFTDPAGIDFNLPTRRPARDNDWRWGDSGCRATWYLLALAAGEAARRTAAVIIGYLCSPRTRVWIPPRSPPRS